MTLNNMLTLSLRENWTTKPSNYTESIMLISKLDRSV